MLCVVRLHISSCSLLLRFGIAADKGGLGCTRCMQPSFESNCILQGCFHQIMSKSASEWPDREYLDPILRSTYGKEKEFVV